MTDTILDAPTKPVGGEIVETYSLLDTRGLVPLLRHAERQAAYWSSEVETYKAELRFAEEREARRAALDAEARARRFA